MTYRYRLHFRETSFIQQVEIAVVAMRYAKDRYFEVGTLMRAVEKTHAEHRWTVVRVDRCTPSEEWQVDVHFPLPPPAIQITPYDPPEPEVPTWP